MIVFLLPNYAVTQDNGWSHLSLPPPSSLSPPATPQTMPRISRAVSPALSTTAPQALEHSVAEPSFEGQRFAAGVPVRLNLLGRVFAVSWALLARLPTESRLGRLVQSRSLSEVLAVCDRYEARRNEFYFNHRHQERGRGGWGGWLCFHLFLP